ncbi:MAG: prepilin-type N-terminal cleavage/methylation domain-containing protein [Gammaproteobacteria bacterium]|nr:prepilin-type N-terminal cleavage/methylation domain-containing protein [Gammaproteobacteria bacterium]
MLTMGVNRAKVSCRARETGLTLVELMIALVLGLVVVGAGIRMLSTTLATNTATVRTTRANQDLRGAMTMIARDLVRAGSWGLAAAVANASQTSGLKLSGTSGTITATSVEKGTDNPNAGFAAPFTDANLNGRTLVLVMSNGGTATRYNLSIATRPDDNSITATVPSGVTLPSTTVNGDSWTILNPFSAVTVGDSDADGVNDCLLIGYDLDADGEVDDSDPGPAESFGYRLDADDGAIETATNVTSCTAGSWESLTDDEAIEVTALSFEESSPAPSTVNLLTITLRAYTVQMTGRLRSDEDVVRSLRETVKVRNSRVN